MKEKPILFQLWKVKRILEWDWRLGNMQTRRVIDPDRLLKAQLKAGIITTSDDEKNGWRKIVPLCPYGQPGDRLWVREAWGIPEGLDPGRDAIYISYPADEKTLHIFTDDTGLKSNCTGFVSPPRWRSPMFMPRWASRITLEIVTIRVERVQEISEEDVVAEGIGAFTLARGVLSDTPPDLRWKFVELWDSINAKRGYGWEVNPWVWVVEFRRVDLTPGPFPKGKGREEMCNAVKGR